MKLKNIIFSRAVCIFFILVLLCLSGCQTSGSKQPISLTTFQLNTVITIAIYDSQDQQLLQEWMQSEEGQQAQQQVQDMLNSMMNQ